jgi:hypothetical protein
MLYLYTSHMIILFRQLPFPLPAKPISAIRATHASRTDILQTLQCTSLVPLIPEWRSSNGISVTYNISYFIRLLSFHLRIFRYGPNQSRRVGTLSMHRHKIRTPPSESFKQPSYLQVSRVAFLAGAYRSMAPFLMQSNGSRMRKDRMTKCMATLRRDHMIV